MRNEMIVLAAIMAITYGVPLRPPGGIDDNGRVKVSDGIFYLILLANSFSFMFSAVLMVFMMPAAVLALPIVVLSFSYGMFWEFISPGHSHDSVMPSLIWGAGYGLIAIVATYVRFRVMAKVQSNRHWYNLD